MTIPNPDHPAKFSPVILDELRWLVKAEADRLERKPSLLDPFAGVGRIHQLEDVARTYGVELEPEWAACHSRTRQGDATALQRLFRARRFDIIATSPCLEQTHRVMTDDLRWASVGDLRPGDRVLAFDENGDGATGRGVASRRRWRRAEVTRSVPRSVECVRVILANGDEIVTTPEHPWLAYRYAYGGFAAEWVPSRSLGGVSGAGRSRRGFRRPFFVMRQVEPWIERRSFDAGWLSGMFDGEGSLTLGAHGSPKMELCQVGGPVLERAESLMDEFGYGPNLLWRQQGERQKIGTLYVTGGFPGMLRALGELRPTRLMAKWETLDVSTRTVQAERVAVLGVEPAGRRDIQEVETSEGTYFGEGYLMHNCYGNRTADHHEARDASRRITYRHKLGRMPSDGSAAVLQWGPEYRELHGRFLRSAHRTLSDDGLLVVNMSNHLRKGQTVYVVEWWVGAVAAAGFRIEQLVPVETSRMKFGENHEARVPCEHLIVARKP